MSLSVVLLKSAEQDIKALKTYVVKSFGKTVWQASYQKLKDSTIIIKTFPYSGNIPEELEKLHLTQYRQVISGMNRIIYEVRQEVIYIHIICDTRKDMNSLVTQRLLRTF
jgi:toxin ParE1/3/4